jgi:riboflavin transporter
MRPSLNSRELALCGALAAVSAVTQIIHLGIQSAQFGMWIDLVASSWLIAFFLFGIRGALITSIAGALFIALFAGSSWLGAIMKWAATMPMWLSLSIFATLTRKSPALFANLYRLLIPLIIGLLLRCVIIVPLNYYFAIPLWTGMTASKAIEIIPWYVICGFNLVQGFIDVGIAWVIAFRFKLIRFSRWDCEVDQA